jgi:hypothetical protein
LNRGNVNRLAPKDARWQRNSKRFGFGDVTDFTGGKVNDFLTGDDPERITARIAGHPAIGDGKHSDQHDDSKQRGVQKLSHPASS